MEKTYLMIRRRAKQAGLSVATACAKAGVDPHCVHYWRNREPKTLETLRKLLQAIETERVSKLRFAVTTDNPAAFQLTESELQEQWERFLDGYLDAKAKTPTTDEPS